MRRYLLTLAVGLIAACAPAQPTNVATAQDRAEQPTSTEMIRIDKNQTMYRLRFSNGDRCYYIANSGQGPALACIPSYMPTAGETHSPPHQ